MGFFDKLKSGLSKTKDSFNNQINNVFSTFRKVDEEFFNLIVNTASGNYFAHNEVNGYKEIAILKDGVTL